MDRVAFGISHESIDQVRRFERLYGNYLRMTLRDLDELSRADERVINELSFLPEGASGAWLGPRLGIDQGYLCRILKTLEAYRLVRSCRCDSDGRVRIWTLTREGNKLAASIEREHRDRVRFALLEIPPRDQVALVEAMAAIERILASALSGWRGLSPRARAGCAGGASRGGVARGG